MRLDLGLGGNFFTGDAYGGSANNPLPGLTAQDYD
jgi:hypothetical protein